jgi:hypothetical protein
VQKRALTGAGLANDGDDLACFYFEAQVAKEREFAANGFVRFLEVCNLDERRGAQRPQFRFPRRARDWAGSRWSGLNHQVIFNFTLEGVIQVKR